MLFVLATAAAVVEVVVVVVVVVEVMVMVAAVERVVEEIAVTITPEATIAVLR